MKKRFIASLWGLSLIVIACTWPVTVMPLWILTGFNVFGYISNKIVVALTLNISYEEN
jgi:hypothetical protein